MRPIELGQRVQIDLFGLQVGGQQHSPAQGVVVAVHPGAITVRVGEAAEVTVSQRRVSELGI